MDFGYGLFGQFYGPKGVNSCDAVCLSNLEDCFNRMTTPTTTTTTMMMTTTNESSNRHIDIFSLFDNGAHYVNVSPGRMLATIWHHNGSVPSILLNLSKSDECLSLLLLLLSVV